MNLPNYNKVKRVAYFVRRASMTNFKHSLCLWSRLFRRDQRQASKIKIDSGLFRFS